LNPSKAAVLDAPPGVARVLYAGETLRVEYLTDRFAELRFDRREGSVNKFDHQTVAELRDAIHVLERLPDVRGVLVTSGKPDFIVGADIREFGATFALPNDELLSYLARSNAVFVRFESLDLPSVAVMNGFSLGGGLEFALAATHRVMAQGACVGLPEVGLGLLPGFGGTVRLPRIVGLSAAIEWIATGASHNSTIALETGVADAVFPEPQVRAEAIALLGATAASGAWRSRRRSKQGPIALTDAELHSMLAAALAAHGGLSSHTPAARAGIELLGRTAGLQAADALIAEAEVFAGLTKSQAAASLVQVFVNEQQVRKLGRALARSAVPLQRVAIWGNGSLAKRLMTSCMTHGVTAQLNDPTGTRPRATPAEFDIAVECGGQDLAARQLALGRIEALSPGQTALLVCLSDMCLADLGARLERPELLIGLHFCDALARPTLVEVVRGPVTDGAAVARAVSLLVRLGWTPLVVEDGPGFLVQRVFMAYTRAFLHLLAQGVEPERIERAMEACGWSLGLTSLPFRKRLTAHHGPAARSFDDREIVDLMMLPLVIAAASALEDGVVSTAAEVDMAMVWGLGFPRHWCGPLKYADWNSLRHLAALSESFAHHGPAWKLTPSMLRMARDGSRFYPVG
jgi:3-hydroxyacyl-CoA dehydrogenase/enoyl-CoA hydratase/3-hydroxybutyryl-CoA epimerase/enoyl-CoA isomerase